MSHRWFHFWLAALFSIGSLRAQTFLGNAADGSHYSYSVTVNNTGSPGLSTGGYGWANVDVYTWTGSAVAQYKHQQGYSHPGLASWMPDGSAFSDTESFSGTFVVPPGASYSFVVGKRYYQNAEGSVSTWQAAITGPFSGTAGTWVPPSVSEKQLSYKLPANTGTTAITWQLVNAAGEVVGYVTKSPGSAETIWTVDGLPPDAERADYTLKFFMPGLKFDSEGGTWVAVTDPGSGAAGTASVFTPTIPTSGTGSGTVVDEGTIPTPAITAVVPAPTVGPSAPPQPVASGGTVWRAGGGSGGITDAVFKEGVDKLVTQNADGAAMAKAGLGAKGLGDAATSSMGGEGTAAKAQASAVIGSAPTGVGYSLSAGGAPTLAVTMPSQFGGGTFDFNPFSSDRFAAVCSWFRAATAWLTIALLAGWVWTQMGEWVRGFSTVPQAKGNPIVGGTGAQATALTAAALMTTAIVAALTALVGWSFGDINVPSLIGSITTNPMATIPAGALWMLDQVFPVATMLTALVARIAFNVYASALFAGCAAVVRFIVP